MFRTWQHKISADYWPLTLLSWRRLWDAGGCQCWRHISMLRRCSGSRWSDITLSGSTFLLPRPYRGTDERRRFTTLAGPVAATAAPSLILHMCAENRILIHCCQWCRRRNRISTNSAQYKQAVLKLSRNVPEPRSVIFLNVAKGRGGKEKGMVAFPHFFFYNLTILSTNSQVRSDARRFFGGLPCQNELLFYC